MRIVLECDTYCIHPQPKGKPALCNRSLGSSESHLKSAHVVRGCTAALCRQRCYQTCPVEGCAWIFHALTEVNDVVGIQKKKNDIV